MKRICVFCGSSAGTRPEYSEQARLLGIAIVRRGMGVVYGGGSVGLMGVVADAALAAGGEVHGVIPERLMERELDHRSLTRMHVVKSMHERKALMSELSDGFVALPGGMGTLEELTEVLTWSQLGLHQKPVGLLDVAGYYDQLTAFFDHAVRERFLHPEHRRILLTDPDPDALLDRLQAWRPLAQVKWIDQRSS
ncbi:MAG TPA: TIGR00730 family Rossman fold protein [Anaeromyxobacteraceae bacterium]|nr:TIGR00730 family Rossman fold protein [Anaeromyxobacteraceae bacterium]